LAPAGTAIAMVFADGHEPSMMEILDRASLRQVEAAYRMDLDVDAACLLLIQAAGDDADTTIAAIAAICERGGASFVYHATDPQEGDLLIEARRRVWPAMEQLGKLLLPEDVAVPRERLTELLAGITRIGDDTGVQMATIGHAGDGNMHPLFVIDPDDPEELERAKQAFAAILDLSLELDGTIAAEHGIGTLKRDYIERELDPVQLEVQRRVRHALDPDGRFNPGKAL
ncbi:MAG: FAD-binding oxidoreductase, partial [Actinobacteria bacterium]|nr:FAD-binding oxidoreductase [Actinomycetota bacterium]